MVVGTAEDAAVRAALADDWDLPDAVIEPHHGGMNSATWFVRYGDRRWVAKSVPPADRDALLGGLAVATHLDSRGLRAGAPVPARDGRTVVTAGGAPLALLTWVPGEPLDAGDQTLIGATLAAVHHGLESFDLPAARRFHWIEVDAPHLGVRPWVRPAVSAAVRAYTMLGPLTWGLLHADPAPEAFRYDRETGVCGVIDWSVGLSGPLLYDLASAAMYVGGLDPAGPLIDAYLCAGPLTAGEVRRGLATMLRFRLAVQADYFARRIVGDDLTGVESSADNDKGLSDAQRYLA